MGGPKLVLSAPPSTPQPRSKQDRALALWREMSRPRAARPASHDAPPQGWARPAALLAAGLGLACCGAWALALAM